MHPHDPTDQTQEKCSCVCVKKKVKKNLANERGGQKRGGGGGVTKEYPTFLSESKRVWWLADMENSLNIKLSWFNGNVI